MGTTLEIEPIYVTTLTGRMGALVVESRGVTWRGELMLTGRMGAVTRNGEATETVPVWFQRRMARETARLVPAFAPDAPSPDKGTISGSHGEMTFSLATGAIIDCTHGEYGESGFPAEYAFAKGGRFDLAEFREYWTPFHADPATLEAAMACADILDAQIIGPDGTREPAEFAWRAGVLATWLYEKDSRLNPEGFESCPFIVYAAVVDEIADDLFGLTVDDLGDVAAAQKNGLSPLAYVLEQGERFGLTRLPSAPKV